MNIAAVFIVHFGIKEALFHRDTGACRGQYVNSSPDSDLLSRMTVTRLLETSYFKVINLYFHMFV